MTELFEAVASWQNLVFVLVVFGIAPGAVLRLFVRCYPKGDPRRRELVAELYAVPRIQRPLWVAEQMETALFEGCGLRIQARQARSTNLYRARRLAAWWIGLSSTCLAAVVTLSVMEMLPIWIGVVLSVLQAVGTWQQGRTLVAANQGIRLINKKLFYEELCRHVQATNRAQRPPADSAAG